MRKFDINLVKELPSLTTGDSSAHYEVLGSWGKVGDTIRLYRNRTTQQLFQLSTGEFSGGKLISRGNDGKSELLQLENSFEDFQVLNGDYSYGGKNSNSPSYVLIGKEGGINWYGSEENQQRIISEKALYFVNNDPINLTTLASPPGKTSNYLFVCEKNNYLIIERDGKYFKINNESISKSDKDNIIRFKHFILNGTTLKSAHRLTKPYNLYSINDSSLPLTLIALKPNKDGSEAIFWSHTHTAFVQRTFNTTEYDIFSKKYDRGEIPEVFSLDYIFEVDKDNATSKIVIDQEFISQCRNVLDENRWWSQDYKPTLSQADKNRDEHLSDLIRAWDGKIDNLQVFENVNDNKISVAEIGESEGWKIGFIYDKTWQLVKFTKKVPLLALMPSEFRSLIKDKIMTVEPEIKVKYTGIFLPNDLNWVQRLPYINSGIYEVIKIQEVGSTRHIIFWDGKKLYYRSVKNYQDYKSYQFVKIDDNLETQVCSQPANFQLFNESFGCPTSGNYIYQCTLGEYQLCSQSEVVYKFKIPVNDCEYYKHFNYNVDTGKVTHRLAHDTFLPWSNKDDLTTLIGIKKLANSFEMICWNHTLGAYTKNNLSLDSEIGNAIYNKAKCGELEYIFGFNQSTIPISKNFNFGSINQTEAVHYLKKLGWFLNEDDLSNKPHEALDEWDGDCSQLLTVDMLDLCVAEFENWRIGYVKNEFDDTLTIAKMGKNEKDLFHSSANCDVVSRLEQKINNFTDQITSSTITLTSATTTQTSSTITFNPKPFSESSMNYTAEQCAEALTKFFRDREIEDEVFDFEAMFPDGSTSRLEVVSMISNEIEGYSDLMEENKTIQLANIFLDFFSIEDTGASKGYQTQPFTPLDLYNCVEDWLESDLICNDLEMRDILEWMVNDEERFFGKLNEVLEYYNRPVNLKDEAVLAAYRVAAAQLRKVFSHAIDKTLPSSSIKDFFQTTIGREMLNWMLGYGLEQVNQRHCQELAEEFRVAALSEAGNQLIETVFSDVLKLIPPPARIALPENEKLEMEEQVEETKEVAQEL